MKSLSIRPITLAEAVVDTRQRSLELLRDLDEEQLIGPRLPIVNPLLWEMGHLAWFGEKWVLRHADHRAPSRSDADSPLHSDADSPSRSDADSPLRSDADSLYDSSAVPHDLRWDLPLPSRAATLDYMNQVQERILDVVHRGPTAEEAYFILLSVFHEDMHGEAFFYTRQTLGYCRPSLSPSKGCARCQTQGASDGVGPLRGDVQIPGGIFYLGAGRDEPFVFDNEKWSHPVPLQPFAIARAPVTQGEFAEFVADDGYGRAELWGKAGWLWRQAGNILHPLYWRHDGNGWLRRDFDCWLPLEPHRPVIHINWYEAEAYCRWSGRRLPTEAEWEAAAAATGNDLSAPKHRFPWGDELPNPTKAQLDGYSLGCCDVVGLGAGDSHFGCRQMIGNVW